MLQNLNSAITEVQIIKILSKPSKSVAAQILFLKQSLYLCLYEKLSGFIFLSEFSKCSDTSIY